jgi:hypothetical protein
MTTPNGKLRSAGTLAMAGAKPGPEPAVMLTEYVESR